MDENVKSQWVAALRSGEYKQGHYALHTVQDGEERFCCLGVLCDLAVRAGEPILVTKNEETVTYDREAAYLPKLVTDWAGLDHKTPRVNDTLLNVENDGGSSFEQIADLIEAHL